jgi:hypothetical protein
MAGWLCVQAGSPRPAAAPVAIAPGDDLQAAIDRRPPGTTFLIRVGKHRLQSVQPKRGDIFTGEPGAILTGAVELTDFRRQGRWWAASLRAQPADSKGDCGPAFPTCNLPEDMFVDDVPLRRVGALDQLAPGRWYLDYGAGLAYAGEDPGGRKVEVSIARFAFAGTAPDVTIRGLTIEKYASVTGTGAVHCASPAPRGPRARNWLVENNEIRWNHGLGIWIGNSMRVLHNRLLHNGHMGAGGTGDDVRIEGNEIAFNNFAGYDYHWGAGGAKFVLSERLELVDNFVHNNEGPGLWADIDCLQVLFERNRTSANKVAGLFFEISSGATIRDNEVEAEGENPGRNGADRGAGIVVNTSSNVEISGNKVKNCTTGILAILQNRGSSRTSGTPHVLRNVYVHDNTVTLSQGVAAGIRSWVGAARIDPTNRFENNIYFVRNSTAPLFIWDDGLRTIAQWKSAGNDRGGRFNEIR